MFQQVVASLYAPLRVWLDEHGIDNAALLASAFTREEVEGGAALAVVNADLGIEEPAELEKLRVALTYVIEQSISISYRGSSAFSRRPMCSIMAERDLKRLREQEEAIEGRLRASSFQSRRASVPPPPVRMRHATSRRRAVQTEGDERGRERAELRERERWVDELVDILSKLGAGCLTQAAQSQDPKRAVRLMVGGRRVSTLRARIREWRRASVWLRGVLRTDFFVGPAAVADYLCDRFDQAGSKSALKSAYAGIRFMEDLLGVAEVDRPSSQPLAVNAMKELVATAAARQDGRVKRQAPPHSPKSSSSSRTLWYARIVMSIIGCWRGGL